MYTFVGDIFMLPDDPLGRDGPALDEFLQKFDLIGSEQNTRLFANVQRGFNSQQRTRHDSQGHIPDSEGEQQGQTVWKRDPLNTDKPPMHIIPIQQPNPGLAARGYQPHGATVNRNCVQDYKPRGKKQHRQPQQNYDTTIENQRQQQQNSRQQQAHHETLITSGIQPSNSKPLRTEQDTNWLGANLEKIFPSDIDKVHRVLENHPFETDMNKLSGYILEIL